MRFGEIVKQYRSKHGLSQRDMAKLLDCSYAYICMLENGINPKTGKPVVPSMKYFKNMADLVGKDLNELSKMVDDANPCNDYNLELDGELLPGLPTKEKKVFIPVLGSIVAGNPIDAIEERIGWEDIPASMAKQGQHFALRVKGQSMEPKFIEGDTVIVRKESDVESGRVAVILIDKEEATLKQVNKSEAGITLIGYNPIVYEPHFYSNQEIKDLPVQIIGEVVELRRKI